MNYDKRLKQVQAEITALVEEKSANYNKYRPLAEKNKKIEERVQELYKLKNHLEHAAYLEETVLKVKP